MSSLAHVLSGLTNELWTYLTIYVITVVSGVYLGLDSVDIYAWDKIKDWHIYGGLSMLKNSKN